MSLRRFLRDVVIETLAVFPFIADLLKVRLLNRGILWMLFRLEKNEIAESAVGPRFCRFRMWLDWQNRTSYVLGTYEPAVAGALREAVRPGDCCFDVGAHIGYYAIMMSRLAGRGGQVVAFEPLPVNFEMLQNNISLNSLLNVALEQAALSDKNERLRLTFALENGLTMTPSASGYNVEGQAGTIDVQAFSLDSYVSRLGRSPNLILIDVEAAELAALRGARDTLEKAHPKLLIEIHGWDNGSAGHEVERYLSNLGYRSQLIGVRGKEAFSFLRGQAAR